MVKRNEKSIWRRMDEKLGFFQDERTEQVQLSGVRNSYRLAVVLLPSVAAYQQFVNGQDGIFWLMLTAAFLSILFLFLRRYQLGGNTFDERIEQLLNRSYRIGYIFLLLPIGGYAFYLLSMANVNSDPPAGMFWWPLAMFLTLIPLFTIHLQKESYPTRTWRLVLLIGLIIFIVSFLIGFLI